MICVLVVASGAAWERRALEVLGADGGIVVLKRCVDVDDLLAAATLGQAQAAVVGLDAPGLDVAAVEHLRRHRVQVVGIASGSGDGLLDQSRMRASRIGIATVVAEGAITDLAASVSAAVSADPTVSDGQTRETPPAPGAVPPIEPDPRAGKVIAVWGPQGGPGRTTVATGLAAVLARQGTRTILVDADPYGGAVAAHLGVLDEVSGMLSAARLASSGLLGERIATVQRGIAERLTVVTGLPRPDRRVEVRPGAVEHLLEELRGQGTVVVDTGFSLEEDPGSEFGSRPGRNAMTLGALSVADEVVVVGTADPVGLARLARALVDLRDLRAGLPVRVVVNRMRTSLGWSERDIAGMVEGFARVSGLAFLPDDRAGVDRALVAGRLLTETGESALLRALEPLAAGLVPPSEAAPATRRRAGRGLRR